MTASRVPLGVLDELEAALVKATPGPWTATTERADGGSYIDPPRSVAVQLPDAPWVGRTNYAADAALVVAAVNAAPKLVRALRDLLTLADDYDRTPNIHGSIPEDIRYAINTALGGAG